MGEREKKDMMRIMEEHEPEREFSFLKTLVENNSRTLQVPADFLLYRAKSPKTKSEYYLHHLRWLIDRKIAKMLKNGKGWFRNSISRFTMKFRSKGLMKDASMLTFLKTI